METRDVQYMGQFAPDLSRSGSACFGYAFYGLTAFDHTHSNRGL